MPPFLISIIAGLFQNNLNSVAQAVITKGLDSVEEKLGIKLEPVMSPEKIAEVQAAAIKHEEFLLQHEEVLVKEANANTDSARDMNSSIQTSDHASTLSKNAAYIIDFCIVGAAIIVSWLAFFKGVPVENKELVYMALGSLWTLVGTIVNFHRGSSRASQGKDDLIRKLSDGNATKP
jgi:hypothetical protein